MFSDGRYWESAQRGEFAEVVLKENHPSPKDSAEPYCTLSQFVAYLDALNMKVAQVHQYLRPNGEIGGSGRPDPKTLFKDGVLYYV